MFDPADYDLPAVLTGCTYDQVITINVDNTPKDLSACTPYLHILKNGQDLYDSTLYISKLDSAGVLQILISADVTSLLPIGNLKYRIEIRESDGAINRYMEGTLGVRD